MFHEIKDCQLKCTRSTEIFSYNAIGIFRNESISKYSVEISMHNTQHVWSSITKCANDMMVSVTDWYRDFH